jgi:hypothetical protein
MKQLILFASVMLSVTAHSQWMTETYVDDFGAETGQDFQYFESVGLFSNSATTNSPCGFFIIHNEVEDMFSVSIYPYDRDTKESWIESTYQDIKIKTPSGKVKTVVGFCYEKGLVLFSDEDYKVFKNAIADKGDYTFLLNYKGEYSDNKYRFKFKIL